MRDINHRPPESMTTSERMDEVAGLLARGLSRLWEASVAKSANAASQSHLGLGYCGHPSVHTDPLNNVSESK